MDTTFRRLRRIKTYSEELGLDLNKPEDRFKWFLASMIFAKRISSQVAKKTFKMFQNEGLVTPEPILKAGWDRLVEVLDSGGYVRYDFSTATNLLDVSKSLLEKFGSISGVHKKAEPPSIWRNYSRVSGHRPGGSQYFSERAERHLEQGGS
ncbi:MAG: hypothetical protein QXU11_02905 [Thermoproteota archaeon]